MRVKPIITYGLVASALFAPLTVHALGLGKLTVDSALGQPLSAKIELLPGSKEELDSVVAKVADPALYRQNNLQYQAALSRARVTMERGANGETYLRVSSPTLMNEPYLDLMVEVNWSGGRVVRDYTFLLDPPNMVADAAPVEPVTPPRGGSASRAQAAPVAAAPSAPQAAAAPRANGDSYTVKRGDTLSRIAKDYKPETVTVDQMLVALFKSNQGAFEGANMNRLRSGAIITIPSAVDTSSTQPAEATKVVKVQAADWRAYRDHVAGAAPMADESGSRVAGGKIGTAVEDKVPAARPGSDQLKLSKDGGVGKGSGAAESAVAQAAALKEAQGRIADLEKTLRDLQRAVDLKNQTMAQLQTDAGKGKAPAVLPPPTNLATPAANAAADAKAAADKAAADKAAEIRAAADKAAADAKSAADAKAAADARATADAKAAADKAAADAKAAAPVVAQSPTPAAPAAEVKPPEAKAPAPKPAPKAAPGMFDDLLANTPTWVVGGGALAILVALGALIASRRRKTTKFEDSIISGTDIKTNTVFGSTGGGVVNTGDNSLASDFSREGLGNIDTDEVDPIAEAEVYLAYGRDAQAEEILKDALKKDPQRQEIYLKLLEIHAQHNKPSAFETVASELYAVCNGQGETWHKAVALGRQLDPNNPMFAEGGVPVPAADLHPIALAAEAALAEGKGDDEHGLEFQMDEEISISPSSGATPKTPADILAGAESELEKTAKSAGTMFTAGAAAATAALAGAMSAGKSAAETRTATLSDKVEAARESFSDGGKYDLDFKLEESEKPAPMGKTHVEPALATTAAEGSDSGMAPQLTRPAAALELDKLDLSFDPDRSTFEDPTPSVLDGQWHDAATKLDLAKAYQEMGDVEGAREILQEVLHEGDDQQKTEAKALLAKLA
jgi:pilus assembly protein FimV